MTTQFINEVCTTIQNMEFSHKIRLFGGDGLPFASAFLEGYLCGKRHSLTPERTAEILGTDEFDSLEGAWYKIFRRFLDEGGERKVSVQIVKREA